MHGIALVFPKTTLGFVLRSRGCPLPIPYRGEAFAMSDAKIVIHPRHEQPRISPFRSVAFKDGFECWCDSGTRCSAAAK